MTRRQAKCWSAMGVVSAVLTFATFASPRTSLENERTIGGAYVHARDPKPMFGTGFGVRFGPRVHLPFLVIAPEVGVDTLDFVGDFAPTVYRGTAGLRIGLGDLVRPGAFGHLGIGHLDGVDGSQAADRTRTALTWDAGLAFDMTFLPIVDVGVHATRCSIAALDADPAFDWLMLGLHASLVF